MSVRAAFCFVGLVCLATVAPAGSLDQTVGLFLNTEDAFEGYTLFGPSMGNTVYLLNNDGLVVHRWDTPYRPGLMGYLREDGHLVRAARSLGDGTAPPGFGGHYQEFDWDGNLVWEWFPDYDQMLPHHDIEILPNGNLLVTTWEFKTLEEVIQAGRDPANAVEMWPDTIRELRPIPPNDAEIVWEWRVWDHLVQQLDPTKDNFGIVADHPELIDVNYGASALSWNHVNGVDYNAELDQVVLSSRAFSEIWVIDHSTTTAEAAGHAGGTHGKGGDLLYRWGNPAAYRRGTESDQQFRGQHDAQWIPPGNPGQGNILVFNNGFLGTFERSSVDEIVPPVDEAGFYSIDAEAPFLPQQSLWSYQPKRDFFSAFISGAERQPNGNTLIIAGLQGRMSEVLPNKTIVWDYVNPVTGDGIVAQGDPVAQNLLFKARRYPLDYPAFEGRDLTPGDPVETFQVPTPVPDNTLSASRLTPNGDQIQVEWDAASCASQDYNLLYGLLEDVASYGLRNADCAIGSSGSHVWNDFPPEHSLFFLVVGTDDTRVYESSWGRDGAGNERNQTAASFECGTTTKVISSTCR